MLLNSYKDSFIQYFNQAIVEEDIARTIEILRTKKRVFFLGNGGSNAICSHMYEDFAKMAKKQTFTFSDAALITCYANDYGYENAMMEWLKIYYDDSSMLFAISSSGNSNNIINAVNQANISGGNVVTLSGFSNENKLKKLGNINFHIPYHSYGIVECYHQVILHVVLDQFVSELNS